MQKEIIIFYSWQSDLPGNNNRNLIQSAIKKVVKNLNENAVAVSADRDTAGMIGTPDIIETVFNKIDETDVFIADISIINIESSAKKTPNPNVLLELGYAAKTIGWDRIICIMNTDYGMHEDLPFDLRTRRILTYSPTNSNKSEARNFISGTIEDTVKILTSDEMLPRQNLEVQESKEILAYLLKEGIGKAWLSYFKRRKGINDEPLQNDFVVVTATHFIVIEKIRKFINTEQYFILHDMLDSLKKMRNETEDAYGWEHAQAFVEKHFEPVYVEYFSQMQKVDLISALKEDVIDLYNSLLVRNEKIKYESSRYSDDGELIFLSEKHYQEAYDNEGNLLCKISIDEKGRISGWKKTSDYIGEYQQGKRTGNGIEYSRDYNYQIFKKREGIWKDDIFIQGTFYGAIVDYEDGEYAWVPDDDVVDDEQPSSKDYQYIKEMLRNEGSSYCKNYYFADMTLKSGEYDIVEGTIKPICSELGGNLDCGCYECDLIENP